MRHVTCERVVSHMRMSHVTHVNESSHCRGAALSCAQRAKEPCLCHAAPPPQQDNERVVSRMNAPCLSRRGAVVCCRASAPRCSQRAERHISCSGGSTFFEIFRSRCPPFFEMYESRCPPIFEMYGSCSCSLLRY